MAKMIELGGTPTNSRSRTEPCRVCHGTGVQVSPKKKSKSKSRGTKKKK